MRKLDWYILKKFFVTFFFSMLLFTVVAIAVDRSEKFDDFANSGYNFSQMITNYYLGFVPFIWSMLFPVFVFISVIFFTSRMAGRSEIIAILASGTSYNRVLRPYLIGGLILSLLLWFGNRYWIPKANIILANFKAQNMDKYDPTKGRTFGNCYNCYYLRTDTNTFVSIREYDTSSQSARGFFLHRIRDDKVIYNLRAPMVRWDTAAKKWQLTNATERKVDSIGEVVTEYPTLFLDINLMPFELRKDDYLKDKLTTPELVAYIRQEELRGTEGLNAIKVERYRRSAIAATVLLLTMIGTVIASRKNRGGSGLHMAIGIVIAAVFVISDRFSTVFASKGNFPPFLAAWFPNIIFAGIGYLLYRKTPK